MALLWPKHVPDMVLQIDSSLIIINMPKDAPCQISQFWLYPIVPFSKKGPKYGPFMAKTSSSDGPSNWFFLSHNQCAQGCSMPNIRVIASMLTDIFIFVTQSVTQALSDIPKM